MTGSAPRQGPARGGAVLTGSRGAWRPCWSGTTAFQLGARVTVTPVNLDIRRVVEDIGALGFHTVGVAPMIASPTGQGSAGGAAIRANCSTP